MNADAIESALKEAKERRDEKREANVILNRIDAMLQKMKANDE